MRKCTNYWRNNTVKDNGTFCVMPWIHLHAWPNGKVYPCCISDIGEGKLVLGDLTQNTVAEIVNSDDSKQLRLDMLNGKQIPSCKNCYNAEKYRNHSWRVDFNKHFEHNIPDLIKNTKEDGTIDPKLLYVDFRFSNFCNLGCRTCGANLSSSIASTEGRQLPRDQLVDYQNKGIINNSQVISFTNVKPNFINDDLKSYLVDTECFYFAGGEPLIQQEHFDILSYVHENKWFNKELRYSSNLSTLKYKNHDLIEYWKDFDTVNFIASIDHFGDKLEFIRQNVNSQRVFENLSTLIKNKFSVSINTVASIYNIYYLYDFYNFLDSQGLFEHLERIDILYAFGELHTPALLPEFAKEELLNKLNEDLKSPLYQKLFKKYPSLESEIVGLPNYINDNNNQNFDDFLKFARQLDTTYGKNLSDTFPWLGDVIRRYKTRK